jgi:hypothetical protein
MGYSCSGNADDVYRSWLDACTALTGVSNKYTANGNTYILQLGKQQHDDAITGKVLKVTGSYDEITQAVKVGSFRIERDGEVSKWPAGLRQLVEVAA